MGSGSGIRGSGKEGRVREDETEAERLDRNFGDLLQELRVAQAGVQILFAFLLTLPFAARFGDVDTFEQIVYIAALLSSALAAACIIAPVAYHRVLFRQGRKPQLVRSAHRMASMGLGFLLVATAGGILLVTDFVLGRVWGAILTAAASAWFVALWVVLPWRSRGAEPGGFAVGPP
jgi:hypothetical protein